MVNIKKLKKDVSKLYSSFRTQQLFANKEIITQMEEVEFLEKILSKMRSVRDLLRDIREGNIRSYVESIYSRSKTFSKKNMPKREDSIEKDGVDDLKRMSFQGKKKFLEKGRRMKSSSFARNKRKSILHQEEIVEDKEVTENLEKKIKSGKERLIEFFRPNHKLKARNGGRVKRDPRMNMSQQNFFKNKREKLKNFSFANLQKTQKLETNRVNVSKNGNFQLKSFDSNSISTIQPKMKKKGIFTKYNEKKVVPKINRLNLDIFSQNKLGNSAEKKDETEASSRLEMSTREVLMVKTSRRGTISRIKKPGEKNISQSFYFDSGLHRSKTHISPAMKQASEEFSLEDLEIVFQKNKKNLDKKISLKKNKTGKNARLLGNFLRYGKMTTPNLKKDHIGLLSDSKGNKMRLKVRKRVLKNLNKSERKGGGGYDVINKIFSKRFGKTPKFDSSGQPSKKKFERKGMVHKNLGWNQNEHN